VAPVASNISQAKARLSALSRHRNPSDPAVARARAELEAAVRADREARRQAVQRADAEWRESRYLARLGTRDCIPVDHCDMREGL
jgi:hypothetical protein